ncbi:unnamed protein product [Ambrosiozyma monospora]|uniref:Unnamed protein product n=1 Tax=Ambrosiozyma monospora TaxID=43982 RepID=A0ACB5SZU5_AMBMO|nr:unnamed protein product [Ambrosiozyma monospora]
MKNRVSALDLKILVSEIEKSIKGYRLQNIYSLVANNRSFLLKFSVPDSKINLVIESGFKAFLTEFQRPTEQQPTGFAVKLRKHLKTKRLTNVKQVGNDRIAVFEFSDGFYYLVLEFFSAGNILLLDENKKIMAVFRIVEKSDKNAFNYGIGEEYPLFDLSLFKSEETTEHDVNQFTKEQIVGWVLKEKELTQKKVLSINKMCFMKAAYLSSDLIQIKLKDNGVNPSASCLDLENNDELLELTAKSLNDSEMEVKKLINTPIGEVTGYIMSKKNPLYKEDEDASDVLEFIYDEFHPYEPVHKKTDKTRFEAVKGYNKTLDKFFTTIESTKKSLTRIE